MAWRKVNFDEDKNLRCDISDDDIYAAVHDLKNQLRDAGVVVKNPPKSCITKRRGGIGKKSISAKVASKYSSKEKSSVRKNHIALAMRRKREKL